MTVLFYLLARAPFSVGMSADVDRDGAVIGGKDKAVAEYISYCPTVPTGVCMIMMMTHGLGANIAPQ